MYDRFGVSYGTFRKAISILKCGSLLSAVNARKLPDTVLQKEDRNAANDPTDFFHYVMFSWGNCQAGDRLEWRENWVEARHRMR